MSLTAEIGASIDAACKIEKRAPDRVSPNSTTILEDCNSSVDDGVNDVGQA
jgi:hypothetical protein